MYNSKKKKSLLSINLYNIKCIKSVLKKIISIKGKNKSKFYY